MTATSRATALATKRAKRVASLAIAEATYNRVLAKDLREYGFSSGEGNQNAKRQELAAIRAEIQFLEAEIEQIDGRLNGGGIVGITVQRWQE